MTLRESMPPTILRATASVLLLGLAWPAAAQEEARAERACVAVGAQPRYAFESPILNGPAVRSLADLRGRPVLVGFWGTRCGVCVGGAVPSVIALSDKYRGELEVLFVESWAEPQKSAAYALHRKWLRASAMWTHEVPFPPAAASLPRCVLLDARGRVVLEGNPLTMKTRLESAVAREVELARRPPEGTPAELAPAWLEFHRDRVGRALQLAVGAAQGSDDEEIVAAAKVAIREFTERTNARVDRIERLIDAGYYVRAEGLAEELRKGLGGAPELIERVDGLLWKLESAELKPEVEAAKALFDLESELFKSGPVPSVIERLESFEEHHPGTRAVERARQLLQLASVT